MTITVVQGMITPQTINDVDCVAVTRIFKNGELKDTPISISEVDDDTYLLSAISIDRESVQFGTYKLECVNDVNITVTKTSLMDAYMDDTLRDAMCEVSTLYHGLL